MKAHFDVVITTLDDVVDAYTPVMPPIAKNLEPTFNYISHRCTGTWNLKHKFQFHSHRNFNGVWSLTFLNACSVTKEIMLSSCKMFVMVYLRMSEDVCCNLCCLAACVSICIQFISKVFILYRTDLQWSYKAYRDIFTTNCMIENSLCR